MLRASSDDFVASRNLVTGPGLESATSLLREACSADVDARVVVKGRENLNRCARNTFYSTLSMPC